jgi:hypothetical protein
VPVAGAAFFFEWVQCSGGGFRGGIRVCIDAEHAYEICAKRVTLITNGKKPMVAIAAVMRKIVVTLNARLRDATIPQS